MPRRVPETRRVVPHSSPVLLPQWTGRENTTFGFTGLRFWCWPQAPFVRVPLCLCWVVVAGRRLLARRELLRGAHTGPTLRRGMGELKPSDFVSEAGGQSGRGVCPAGPAAGSRGAATTRCQSTIGPVGRADIPNSSVVVPLHAIPVRQRAQV